MIYHTSFGNLIFSNRKPPKIPRTNMMASDKKIFMIPPFGKPTTIKS
jgi:hypothetical protein